MRIKELLISCFQQILIYFVVRNKSTKYKMTLIVII